MIRQHRHPAQVPELAGDHERHDGSRVGGCYFHGSELSRGGGVQNVGALLQDGDQNPVVQAGPSISFHDGSIGLELQQQFYPFVVSVLAASINAEF